MPFERKAWAARLPDPRSEDFMSALRQKLVAAGYLDELAAHRAERACQQSRERFDVVLVRLGLIHETVLCRTLAAHLSLPTVSPDAWPERPLFPDAVPEAFLAANRIVILDDKEDAVRIAVSDPFKTDVIDALAFQLERPVDIYMAPAAAIERCLERLHGRAAAITRDSVDVSDDPFGGSEAEDVRRLEDLASEAPVIRLVHDLIQRAIESRASDIHVEPREDAVCIRYRIDGALHTAEMLPVAVRPALTSRIKIMARLNIAESRLPQDGRVKFTARGREIDLRVSTMPTLVGESVVLRILDRESVPLDFGALGFAGEERGAFERLLAEPNGIILVTGPTGSGKSTTLYTALTALNCPDRKLFTVEDPIEYRLTGVNQIAINPKIGLTFASALRSILRQDPDIIMVGEIRDLETAEIAIRASLTGHLVLSTVHTNSAAATITRLLDMGVEDYLLASCLKGVLAQRLVRTLCPNCRRPTDSSETDLARMRRLAGLEDYASGCAVHDAVGCAACQETGYHGRTAIYELLTVTPTVREIMAAGAQESGIEAAAVRSGMTTLLQSGMAKVLGGETTLNEVLRVTRPADATLPI